MAWRLQLSSRPIRRLEILPGKPALLAAWTGAEVVHFFDLQHGTRFDSLTLHAPPGDDLSTPEWSRFLDSLSAPNGARLPLFRTPDVSVYAALEAHTRLFQRSTGLTLRTAAGDIALADAPRSPLQCAFDRALALTACLDAQARLHLYRGAVRLGAFDTGLVLDDEAAPQLVASEAGLIFAGDGSGIVVYDAQGQEKRRFQAHFRFAAMACSPDGRLLALADLDSGVLRVFSTAAMTQTHQRFTVDLLAEARKAQLLPVTASTGAAVSAIAIGNKGTLAFSTLGLVCVTATSRMKASGR